MCKIQEKYSKNITTYVEAQNGDFLGPKVPQNSKISRKWYFDQFSSKIMVEFTIILLEKF